MQVIALYYILEYLLIADKWKLKDCDVLNRSSETQNTQVYGTLGRLGRLGR